MAAKNGVDAALIQWPRQEWLARKSNSAFTSYLEALGAVRFTTPVDEATHTPKVELAWRWDIYIAYSGHLGASIEVKNHVPATT